MMTASASTLSAAQAAVFFVVRVPRQFLLDSANLALLRSGGGGIPWPAGCSRRESPLLSWRLST